MDKMIFNKNLTVTESSELNVGERWYIKYLSATALVEVEIKEVSQKTVLLEEVNRSFYAPVRYEKSDIKFVEKVEKV